MAEIRPFHGLRYDQEKVKLSEVVAPPYDVISKEYQEELYRRSPYNVVRLILGKEMDRYREAARNLSRWQEESVLRRDLKPSLYCLAQSFGGSDGVRYERVGFVAACWLEEFSAGVILPHEKTLSKPKEDRFRLVQATKANFSQIFGLYSDPGGTVDGILREVMRADPLLQVDFEGVSNRLWIMNDPATINAVVSAMRGKSILIADGHHRYETALAYRDFMKLKTTSSTDKQPFNYTMMFFADMDAQGLVILPTHRVVHSLSSFDPREFLDRLKKNFVIRSESSQAAHLQALSAERELSFGVVLEDGFYLIRLKQKELLSQLFGESVPPEIRELDVTLLHSYILEKLLGISVEAQERKSNLEYVKDVDDAVRGVHAGGQVAFLMNPTRVDQVRRVARAGHTMPQKSTYFYPKLVTGLVMNSLDQNNGE